MSNPYYPPGVTGNEYAIAGPDYEKETNERCPQCRERNVFILGYQGDRWLGCASCQWSGDPPHDEYDEPDPDRAYDEARERRLFGEE